MDGNIGHNSPPSPAETFASRIDQYRKTVGALGPVTEENAQKYRDEIGFGGKLSKEIDETREKEKKPHLEAGRKIDGTYKPLVEQTDAIQKNAKKLLQDFVVRREREAQEAARAAAEKLRQEQEAALAAQAANDSDPFLAATADVAAVDLKPAEAEAKATEAAALASSRVSSAAGGFSAAGLKTVRKAKVTDWRAMVMHYAGNAEVMSLCERLANADIRHAKGADITIPGVEIVTERVL